MKLAILETGRPPVPLAEEFGNYPEMFGNLLGEEFEIHSFDVEAGELPSDPAAHSAYLITGSPAGVYDLRPWMSRWRNSSALRTAARWSEFALVIKSWPRRLAAGSRNRRKAGAQGCIVTPWSTASHGWILQRRSQVPLRIRTRLSSSRRTAKSWRNRRSPRLRPWRGTTGLRFHSSSIRNFQPSSPRP